MSVPVHPGQPVVVYASGPAPIELDPTQTLNPHSISVTYTSSLSEDAKYLGCSVGQLLNPWMCVGTMTGAALCNCLCWDKLKRRSYVSVHENRIESNYAYTCCCGLCVQDYVRVIFFDQLAPSVKAESSCTPFHCCWCIELCGGVIALAPCDCVNSCLCPCCRTFYPGLNDSASFAAAINNARTHFTQKQRSAPGQWQVGPPRAAMP